MGDVIQFPVRGVTCARCGFVIVLKKDEEPPTDGLCFCCKRNIPLPGMHVHDGVPDGGDGVA